MFKLILSLAFGTVDHGVLLSKLHVYGITTNALDCLKTIYRTQYVDCNCMSSSVKGIETDVPQGSILGPPLFMIYMNDITRAQL